MPLHAVSGGKVMLAYLPDDHLAQILAARLKRFTKQTITDALELRSALERIRQAGYAVAEEEFEEGLSAVAAPIRDAEGHVRAVIGVSGPSFRLPTDRLQELGRVTKRAADEISGHLGRIWQG
jgi:DNA-binding IclR family transcriptional regulator